MKEATQSKRKNSIDAIQFHDQIASEWSQKYKSGVFKQRFKLWSKIIEKYLKSDETWLDAGCGAGDLTKVIVKHCNHTIAFDPSKNMLQSLRNNTEIDLNQVSIYTGKINDLSFIRGKKVSGIICSSVFEYLKNVDSALNECHQILQNDGKLIVSIPTKGLNIRYFQKILRRIGIIFNIKLFNYLEHSVFYETKDNFIRILNQNGFDCLEVYDFKPNAEKILYNFLAPVICIYIAEKSKLSGKH